ncbi:MAG: glycogen-binding domain-containing protein, partial [Deltaproteobacteria bacterium]|nr:glycogen-binding domain-containing protein [Deltaproteobacteria bacterium]
MRLVRTTWWGVGIIALACSSPPGRIEIDAGRFVREGGPRPIFHSCYGDGAVGDVACGEGGVAEVDASFDAGPPPPPCNLITFEYNDPHALSVWLSGSFLARGGRWPTRPEEGALVMENTGGGRWRVQHLVEPIGRHSYKFIIDGSRW